MKVSYRTHPILEKVHKKDIGEFNYYECDQDHIVSNRNNIRDFFKKVSLGINNQIYLLSKSFVYAYEKAGDKLYDSYLFADVEDDNVCFVAPCWDNNSAKETTLLNIRNNVEKKVITCSFFEFRDKAIGAYGTYYIDYSEENERPNMFSNSWTSEGLSNMRFHILNCVLITLFIKYAEVEIKHLNPGQKDKGIECKYINDTKLPVNFLDSRWFTKLVKSDGFNVRGHFRLQPKKKDGKWTKEMIWINSFKKTGYTAQARKLG